VAALRQIVALGGGAETEEQARLVDEFVLSLIDKPRPRLLFVPTAAADDDEYTAWFSERWDLHAEVSHLTTFPWPPPDLRELILSQHGICVAGGNTANMLAIWRVHGIDVLLREAWESGIVLWGASAGMICWFEAGVTDSFGPALDSMECLGFLPGSACPHYDGEEMRRPRYRELIASGLADGFAADDGVGLHFVGTELSDVVSCSPEAAAYRVTRAGEERLEPRLLL